MTARRWPPHTPMSRISVTRSRRMESSPTQRHSRPRSVTLAADACHHHSSPAQGSPTSARGGGTPWGRSRRDPDPLQCARHGGRSGPRASRHVVVPSAQPCVRGPGDRLSSAGALGSRSVPLVGSRFGVVDDRALATSRAPPGHRASQGTARPNAAVRRATPRSPADTIWGRWSLSGLTGPRTVIRLTDDELEEVRARVEAPLHRGRGHVARVTRTKDMTTVARTPAGIQVQLDWKHAVAGVIRGRT